MLKKYLRKILEAADADEAWNTVFYGENGIDMAYQREKLKADEYELLVAVLDRIA